MHEYHLALCTVLLIELGVPKTQPLEDPTIIRKLLHTLIDKALRGVAENSRIAVEKASTAVICFMGDPEEALRSGMLLRDLVAQRYAGLMTVRIALDIGPVKVSTDASDRVRVYGAGVQQVGLVKEQAQSGQLLVSKACHDLLTRLDPDTAELFQYHSPTGDGSLEVYCVIPSSGDAARDTAASFIVTRPLPLFQNSALDQQTVQDVESELVSLIGPLAHVLVRKTAGSATSPQDLRERVCSAILNPTAREYFRIGKSSELIPVRGDSLPAPLAEPTAASATTRTAPRADATRQIDIAPAELAIIEHTLQRFIGRAAQPLMRREIDLCVRFTDFVDAIAASIDHPQQREVFLQALQRALPERQF